VDPAYHVKLEVFEGPLDLLYHLVEKDEIDIWDIPMAHITAQYLAYLDAMRELDIEVAAEFLVMAARLLHIKARMLLPDPKVEGEDGEEVDPRLDLAAALLEYAMFKEAAQNLNERAQGRWALFNRPDVYAPKNVDPVYDDPTGGVSAAQLAKALFKVLEGQKPKRPIAVPHTKVSVPEKVAAMRRLFARRRRVRFDALFHGDASRAEIVATFLALLELVRRGFLMAKQERPFGPIEIERRKESELTVGAAGESDRV